MALADDPRAKLTREIRNCQRRMVRDTCAQTNLAMQIEKLEAGGQNNAEVLDRRYEMYGASACYLREKVEDAERELQQLRRQEIQQQENLLKDETGKEEGEGEKRH